MVVILIFIGFVLIGQAGAIMVATMVESYSKFGSLIAFFGLFVCVFIIAWFLAVRVTERYFVSQKEGVSRPR